MENNSQDKRKLNFLIKLPQYVGAIIKFVFYLAVFVGAILLLRACH